MLYLNLQFTPWGSHENQIETYQFVVGLFDIPINIFFSGASEDQLKDWDGHGLIKCDDSEIHYMPRDNVTECGPFTGKFSLGYHSGFTLVFMDDYVFGPNANVKSTILYFHIFGQSLSLALCYLQLHKPMRSKYPTLHRWSGRICAFSGVMGSVSGGILACWHYTDEVPDYGYWMNAMGVQFCTLLTCTCLYNGVRAAIRKDFVAHKKWMMRYCGAMWGIFLIFRLIFLLIGPLLSVLKLPAGSTYNLCSWTSGPIGILLANYINNKSIRAEREAKLGDATKGNDDPDGDEVPLQAILETKEVAVKV
jgi:hypothetical protein